MVSVPIAARLPPPIDRHWYQTGYHRPQDDLAQPIDWQAAGEFNRFF